jgi:signal transduction histidine kinase
MAEELSARIDTELAERISTAEARNFSDFAFLIVSGDPSANLLQRSPLAEYPVLQDLPGVIGYFQVDAKGTFTSPLVPSSGSATKLGISATELDGRSEIAGQIASILADNNLLRKTPAPPDRTRVPESEGISRKDSEVRESATSSPYRSVDKLDAEGDIVAAIDSPQSFDEQLRQYARGDSDVSQQAFDQLNSAASGAEGTGAESRRNKERAAQDEYTKLADLKFDDTLEKKIEQTGDKAAATVSAAAPNGKSVALNRARRLEQSSLPESPVTNELESADQAASDAKSAATSITTFSSEIDPYEFSQLDSGHLVLFRNVWRNSERTIQGILLDTDTFLSNAIEKEFRATSLSDMSNLIVAYQDNIIRDMRGGSSSSYPVSSAVLQGTLLYRDSLSAPFDRLDLVFSINRLPPGPGAGVLLWTSVVTAIVFLTGFMVLYRLGLSQIKLARQQQDFVSAVSHELKTPLTSIRMYGEMLVQGWVSEDKRKQYYAYIHDESERLGRLISNVLQLARITRNEPHFDLHTRTVSDLMDQLASKIGNQVERAGFILSIQRNETSDRSNVQIDDDSFAQIMINLVDNAIKFSKHAENKSIDIANLSSSPGTVTFSVRDYGPGIARDQMKKIFQLFYRAESELTRETVGTGIGLAIVHQLALSMNGEVDVINMNPGAEFRLTLPATRDN